MPSNTPFFQAFGPLLFGRRPRSAIEKVKGLGSLGEIYELFGEMLPDKLLGRSESGLNSRERILTAKVTFWAFVSQALDPGSACREVVRKVEAWWCWMHKERREKPALSPSAYCQARARLDMQTLRLIHHHLAWSLERNVLGEQEWLGRKVKKSRWNHPFDARYQCQSTMLAAICFPKAGAGLSVYEVSRCFLARQRRS